MIRNQDGIVVTAKSIKPNYEYYRHYFFEHSHSNEGIEYWVEIELDGYYLNLEIENNSDESVQISTIDSSVNGYMFDVSLEDYYMPVGSADTTSVYLSRDELKDDGIKVILDVEFRLEIAKEDDVYTSDFLTVSTWSSGWRTQKYDDSGTVLYDEDGLKIISQGITKDNDEDEYCIWVYVENESGKDVYLQVGDTVQINDMYTMDLTELTVKVLDGKKEIHSYGFSIENMEEDYGIGSKIDFETMETSYKILDPDTLEMIGETGTLTLNLN